MSGDRDGSRSDALVSVIITTYYRNDTLSRAIESARQQSYSPVEIVVVDDSGEGHASPVVPESDEVTFVPLSENQGPQVAREAGLEHVDGEYVQFLDDDDALEPQAIARRVEILEADDEIGVVYCGIDWIGGGTSRPDPEKRGDVLADALAFELMPCLTSTMLIDRAVLEAIRPLDPSYNGAGDNAMKIDLARQTRFDFVEDPLLRAAEEGETVGVSELAIRGRKRILEDYADCYESQEDWVRRTALAHTKLIEGRWHLRDSLWSIASIRAFLEAVYYTPTVTRLHVGEVLASLAGRPGREAARWLKHRLEEPSP